MSASRSGHDGIRVHEVQTLDPDNRAQVTRLHGLPVTTAARTLLDLGAVVSPDQLERALESALRRYLVSVPYLARQLDQVARRGRAGTRPLRTLLARRAPGMATGSDLETLAVQLFRKELGLQFERQVAFDGVPGVLVDLGNRELGVGIELDGYEFHHDRAQLLKDVERQNRLVLAGVVLVRFGWEHIFILTHRAKVLTTVRAAMAHAAQRGGSTRRPEGRARTARTRNEAESRSAP